MNIDSDKLLEWFEDNELGGAEGEACFRKSDFITAIQSGELAPKRVYARAPEGCEHQRNITPGKEYLTHYDDGKTFEFRTDSGYYSLGLWQSCAHLKGANWERVEK